MAVVQISRIQHRRGLHQDLPNLASAELGWSIDEQRLFIGNGAAEEGAPALGRTEILTEHTDILSLVGTYTFKGLSSGSQVQTGPDVLHPTVRTLQDKLDDSVSVKDFGAIGNGYNDDTDAIERALTRTFGSAQSRISSFHHRTIYFPAGVYKITKTLNIPPYTRIQGEGKRTTIIQGSFAGPLAQFADGFGQVGVNFGADDVNGNSPAVTEYHFSDLSFLQQTLSYNQSCLVIDGGTTATFNRIMFRGLLGDTTADYGNSTSTTNPVYDIDRGTGIAAVCVNNNSAHFGVRNLVFSQCDFMDHNYGIELNNEIIGVSVTSCYFDHLYYQIVAGNNSPSPASYIPYGLSIFDNYFRWSAKEALKCYAYVNNVMSLANIYTAAGMADYAGNTPVVNPNGLATSPAITFTDNNNFSMADSFDRADADYALYPNIETNGFDCYLVAQDRGVVNGRLTNGRGHTLTLANASSYAATGITYAPANMSNMTVNYTVKHNNHVRTGTLVVSKINSTISWDDEYIESGDAAFALRANPTTGVVEYTSTPVANAAVFTYNINYFTP